MWLALGLADDVPLDIYPARGAMMRQKLTRWQIIHNK
jgi:hypothetical protein